MLLSETLCSAQQTCPISRNEHVPELNKKRCAFGMPPAGRGAEQKLHGQEADVIKRAIGGHENLVGLFGIWFGSRRLAGNARNSDRLPFPRLAQS